MGRSAYSVLSLIQTSGDPRILFELLDTSGSITRCSIPEMRVTCYHMYCCHLVAFSFCSFFLLVVLNAFDNCWQGIHFISGRLKKEDERKRTMGTSVQLEGTKAADMSGRNKDSWKRCELIEVAV